MGRGGLILTGENDRGVPETVTVHVQFTPCPWTAGRDQIRIGSETGGATGHGETRLKHFDRPSFWYTSHPPACTYMVSYNIHHH